MRFQRYLLVMTALLALIRADSSKCGDRGSSGRIVGGTPAKDWPWVASLRIVTTSFQIHVCTGSLIAPNWILTAAHCLTNATYAVVTLGQKDFTEKVEAQNLFGHPCYNGDYIGVHDIALIRLTREPDLKRNTIGLVCLPQEDVMQREEPYKNCYAVGYGATETGRVSKTPLEIKSNILGKEHCLGLMVDDCMDPKLLFCAKSPHLGSGACTGDSGGPLSCQQDDGLWVVPGTVRSGDICGHTRSATAYTSVFPHLAWIKETQATMTHGPYACFKANEDICKTSTHRIHGVLSETEKFCKNSPTLNITEILKEEETGNLFVAFEEDSFVEAEDPQEKPYPLSTLWLRKGWSEFKGKRKLIPQDVYTFEKGFFFKNKLYVGFSQLWLGCPQPLCTASQVTSVFYGEDTFVAVGHHFWKLPQNFITNRNPAIYSTSANIALPLPSNVVLFIMDIHYIVQRDNKATSYGFIRSPVKTNPFPVDFPLGLDALVHRYSKDCDSLLYAFKGSLYWKMSYKIHKQKNKENPTGVPQIKLFMNRGYPKPVRHLNPQLENIDEAFIHPTLNVLVVFKKWFFAEIDLNPEKSFEDNVRDVTKFQWKYIQTDLFGCEDRLYRQSHFASFAEFREKLISETAFLRTASSQSLAGSFYVLIIILSIAFLVMAAIYFGFGFYKRSNDKFRSRSMKLKEV